MADTTTVTVTLTGVRIERLARLRTLIKTELVRFANNVTVDDGQSKPKKGK